MDYLICPKCRSATMMQSANLDTRKCPNCEHEMNEIEYQIFAAKRINELNKELEDIDKTVKRSNRKNFGKKQRTATAA